ncbi:hypothetical protein VTL71DRAFT_2890 [Oculimacula yallundae]|uniref:Uncharacterized protein n=1 Tax=Oculimacula yallundae TaxID=86028 RepID=A0ABR4C7D8_9HELO
MTFAIMSSQYPERSSSLSAADFPHGPPNSPSSVVPDDLIDLSTLTFEPLDSFEDAPSSIVRPATPLVPSLFGRKSKTIAPSSQKAFIIAISGCSSAGKSRLAKLLSEVFNQATIIAQDDFFQPKYLQPLVTFSSCASDARFVKESIKNDELGMYAIASDGTRPSVLPDGLPNCEEGSHHTRRTSSIDSKSSGSDISRVVEGGKNPLYTITGPLPDCEQATDYTGLVEVLHDLKDTGEVIEYDKRFPCDEDMSEFAGLIEEMKGTVHDWAKQQSILNAEARFGGCLVQGPIENDGMGSGGTETETGTQNGKGSLCPRVVIVEGFLVLAPATEPASVKTSFNISNNKGMIEVYTMRLEALSAELTAKGDIDTALETERDAIEEEIWTINLAAKMHMEGLFDVKLFLDTSKEEAKRRRIERPIYTDAPKGGRLPGQMWKSEGYFEEAVWKGYVESYGWLLEKGGEGEKDGVVVMPVQNAGAEECLERAVEVILAEMGKIEADARGTGGGCCIDD